MSENKEIKITLTGSSLRRYNEIFKAYQDNAIAEMHDVNVINSIILETYRDFEKRGFIPKYP